VDTELSPRFAFLLNVDAERELAGASADPLRAIADDPRLIEALSLLVQSHQVVRSEDVAKHSHTGIRGRAWCPTPRALDALARAGASVPPAPPLDVLRRVNDRTFSIEAPPRGVDLALEGQVARSVDEARELLAKPSPSGRYIMKQPFGFAGKGRLATSAPDAHAIRFAEASIARYGSVAIEPLLDRTLDVSLHGFVRASGELVLGEPTITVVSLGGVHQGSRRARDGDLEPTELDLLFRDGAHVAELLSRAGYYGPFGIDAFRYRLGPRVGFRPRCEINARYTMGWAIGMGERRPDLDLLQEKDG
jgi:hypothetical protein